jgi:tetratricopeptide (TPR) repeat protein
MGGPERREIDKALELSEKERWDEAIAKLEILETSADTEVRDLALNYLADAYAATGRNSDAEAMLRRSIEGRGAANEGLGSQLAVLAPVVRRQGRVEEAEQIYLQALQVQKPDGPEIKVITMRNLAYLYWSTGRQDRAREMYAQLPKCDKGFLGFLSGIMKPYLEPAIPV